MTPPTPTESLPDATLEAIDDLSNEIVHHEEQPARHHVIRLAIRDLVREERTTAHAAGRLEALEEAQRKFGVYAMKYPAATAVQMLEEMKKEKR